MHGNIMSLQGGKARIHRAEVRAQASRHETAQGRDELPRSCRVASGRDGWDISLEQGTRDMLNPNTP
ncbi:MAG: hypothetical protein U0744_10960 [Gemmataceae bacterium]